MFASIISVAHNIGYPLLFVLVMAESSGFPVPGETALISAALLASQGKLQIELVIVLAATAAIVGDNIGYLIGRKGGRWLLERPGLFERHRRRVLEVGEPFFARHGAKAVFFGRWLLGLRVWASWLAGATRMRWPAFAFWNAAGGIGWATTIGLLAYYLGHAVRNVLSLFGLYGLIGVVLAGGGALLLHRRQRRRSAPHEAGRSTPQSASRPASRSVEEPNGDGRAAEGRVVDARVADARVIDGRVPEARLVDGGFHDAP